MRSLPHYPKPRATTASSLRPSFDFEINKGNSVVKRNAFLDSRLACWKCLYAGNDLGTVAALKHPWKCIPSHPDIAQPHCGERCSIFHCYVDCCCNSSSCSSFCPPLLSSPEGFICLGTNCRWRFPLIERGIEETSVFVVHIIGEVSNYKWGLFWIWPSLVDSLISCFRPHNIRGEHKLGGHLKRTHFGNVQTRLQLPWIFTKALNLTINQEKCGTYDDVAHTSTSPRKLKYQYKFAVAGKHLHLVFGYPELKQIIFVCFCVLLSWVIRIRSWGTAFLPTHGISNMNWSWIWITTWNRVSYSGSKTQLIDPETKILHNQTWTMWNKSHKKHTNKDNRM